METIIWVYSLISVLIVSLISLIGVFSVALNKQKLQGILLYLVSFAVGALFGDAFIHLLPEAFQSFQNQVSLSLYILSGIFLFFLVEKIVRWRHCHVPEHMRLKPVAWMNLVGDGVHNFIDGVLIASSFLIDFRLGISTSLAVILHEIPQEIGDFGVLLHSGLSLKKALLFNFLSALTAVLGAVLALIIGQSMSSFSLVMVPIAAGGFIYIAGTDLIPELHHEVNLKNSFKQLLAIIAGILVMLALLLLG